MPTDITPVITFIKQSLQSNANYSQLQVQMQTLQADFDADEEQLRGLLQLIAATPPQPAPPGISPGIMTAPPNTTGTPAQQAAAASPDPALPVPVAPVPPTTAQA